MNKDNFYETKTYSTDEILKDIEDADKRDGITDENRDVRFEQSIKSFINKFSLFCAYKDKFTFIKNKKS